MISLLVVSGVHHYIVVAVIVILFLKKILKCTVSIATARPPAVFDDVSNQHR